METRMSILIPIKVDICIGMDYTSTHLRRGPTPRMFCGSKYLTHDSFSNLFLYVFNELVEIAYL